MRRESREGWIQIRPFLDPVNLSRLQIEAAARARNGDGTKSQNISEILNEMLEQRYNKPRTGPGADLTVS